VTSKLHLSRDAFGGTQFLVRGCDRGFHILFSAQEGIDLVLLHGFLKNIL
jgi:hypothetical protein